MPGLIEGPGGGVVVNTWGTGTPLPSSCHHGHPTAFIMSPQAPHCHHCITTGTPLPSSHHNRHPTAFITLQQEPLYLCHVTTGTPPPSQSLGPVPQGCPSTLKLKGGMRMSVGCQKAPGLTLRRSGCVSCVTYTNIKAT